MEADWEATVVMVVLMVVMVVACMEAVCMEDTEAACMGWEDTEGWV